MSRIGRQPIQIPEGVKVNLEKDELSVQGPKGTLKRSLPREIKVEIEDDVIKVSPKTKSTNAKALHGTYRALIANMVIGVTDGWNKELELVGTGYRAEKPGEKLVLTVGFSHPVEFDVPEGIELKVEKTSIVVSGMDKEHVGQFAAKVRAVRPPEPYKGKGIRYKDEVVRRKAGKATKAQEEI